MPWLVGCNYIPRTAINQLEMWQPETFDPETIKEELGWAESLGFNSLRVFLHDIPWAKDSASYLDRIDQFLGIAAARNIGTMLVFFDSCWHPCPRSGRQPNPEPGVHNSGWVQSPGVAVLRDAARFDQLEEYVSGVMTRFRDDRRVQVWDIWNEPDNPNASTYPGRDLGEEKSAIVEPLIARAFDWARSTNPLQPVTSGIWLGDDWSSDGALTHMSRLQAEYSDVVSFHNYGRPLELENRIRQLQRYRRPLLCTEYMARPRGSTFQSSLPVFQRHRVHAYCWGLVSGRSQTIYSWQSWQQSNPPEPPVWFHDVLRGDGSPYREEEAIFLQTLLKQG